MTAFLLALAAITAVMTLITPLLLMLWVNQSWRSVSMADHYAALTFMTYLTMPQLFFYGAFFLVGQVLNAKEKFAPLMWAPILNNVISIAILAAYVWIWGLRGDANAVFTSPQIWLLGLGSTVGIIGQTILLIPYLRRAGFNYRPRWDLKGTGLGATFHLAKWMIGYVALTVVAQTVVSNLATSATAGGAGAGYNVYSNAYLLWILPHSLITVSLATAMMPNASRRAASGDLEGVERATTEAVRLASTFLLPFAVGFAVLAQPLTALGFGHGRGAADAALVGTTLIAFALGLVPFTIQYLYQRAYYAPRGHPQHVPVADRDLWIQRPARLGVRVAVPPSRHGRRPLGAVLFGRLRPRCWRDPSVLEAKTAHVGRTSDAEASVAPHPCHPPRGDCCLADHLAVRTIPRAAAAGTRARAGRRSRSAVLLLRGQANADHGGSPSPRRAPEAWGDGPRTARRGGGAGKSRGRGTGRSRGRGRRKS
ncbi:MAG: oligosaccharide flippase family protein [Micropruina sp.]|nr:oligosaccharide flippase family protein [Micropruina sp.]